MGGRFLGRGGVESFIDASDGLRLFFRLWEAEENKGLVVILHGFSEHGGRYLWLVDQLLRAGWTVVAMDCRGHGQSGGRRAHVDSFDEYVNDLRSLLDELGAQGLKERPFLLGHSMGGLIATRYAQEKGDELAGLILSSPFFGENAGLGGVRQMTLRWTARLLPSMSLRLRYNPVHLTHDREVIEQYLADPLVSNTCTLRWLAEIRQAQQRAMDASDRVLLPMLLLTGTDDRVVSGEVNQQFFRQAATPDKLQNAYEGYYHEIFNEVGKSRALHDLVTWLEQHRPLH